MGRVLLACMGFERCTTGMGGRRWSGGVRYLFVEGNTRRWSCRGEWMMMDMKGKRERREAKKINVRIIISALVPWRCCSSRLTR